MKILVCGCGSIGSRHVRNIVQFFGHHVLAFDPSLERVNAAASAGAAQTFQIEEQAFDSCPDAVLACGPSSTHIGTVRRAVAVGAHVFVEKPISHSLDGLTQSLEEAERQAVFIGVGCNMRYYPGPKLLKKHLDSLGRVYFTRATVGQYLPAMRPGVDSKSVYAARIALGGGVVLDAVHEIDYHLWLFGAPEVVFCRAARLGDVTVDAEDCAEISLTFPGGSMAQIHMDFLAPCRTRGCEIVGEHGALVWEDRGKPPACSVRHYDRRARQWTPLFNETDLDTNQCYVDELKEFFGIIQGDTPRKVLADGFEGTHALTVALEAKESAATQQVVRHTP